MTQQRHEQPMIPGNGPTWFRFSISSMLLAVVSIASLLGWYSAQRNYAKLSADFERNSKLINAASIEVASVFDFSGIVGRSIDDYPLIQVLGKPQEIMGSVVLDHWSREQAKLAKIGVTDRADRFENKREHWEKIDKNRMVTCYHLLLEDGQLEGQEYHAVTIFVQDSMVRLVDEVRAVGAH